MQIARPSPRAARTATLESHYAALLASHATSGLSLRSFAARHGLSAWTLYGWRRRLAIKQAQPVPEREPQLVAVDVVDADRGGARPAFEYEIALPSGATLRLPRDFDARRVAELLAALRPC